MRYSVHSVVEVYIEEMQKDASQKNLIKTFATQVRS